MTDITADAPASRTSAILIGRHTLVWALLAGITAASWAMGHGVSDTRAAGAIILALAFVKARMVIREFMEVGDAPLPLRIITDLWVGGACALLIGMWLFAG